MPGLFSVLLAGLFQGSFMVPMKWTRGWAWENVWLVFACTAYLLCPWALVLLTIPQAFDIYASVGAGPLLSVAAFGVGWGLGAVTFGLGVAAVGLSLGFVVILGLAATVGTLVPLASADMSLARAAVTGAALVGMLAGVAVSSFAGRWKEKAETAVLSYRQGLAMCAVSGVLSASGNLGFVYGQGIIDRAQAMGVPPYLASNVVWALLTLAVFACNAGYALYLLARNRTFGKFRMRRVNFALGVSMGALWMAGFVFYGYGARQLGALGPSLGWAMLMSGMVVTANLAGIATGEWTGAPPAARRQLRNGVLLLLAAIVGLGYANGMP